MSDMYISVSPTSSWQHTNCWTLVNLSSGWSGCLPHKKTLLQEDIPKEFSFKKVIMPMHKLRDQVPMRTLQ